MSSSAVEYQLIVKYHMPLVNLFLYQLILNHLRMNTALSSIVLLCFLGKVQNFQNAFEDSNVSAGGIAMAFYSGQFSYSGW